MRPPKLASSLFCILCCFTTIALAAGDPLKTLRPSHPRLLALDDSIERIRRLAMTDPVVEQALKRLTATGEKMISEPTARYRLIGPRLLDQSRYALDVISTTTGLYRITGDVRFAERARKEMLAICAFPDWHPPHFLDTAEMTNASSIGYDWIYDRLSPRDRDVIRRSIVEKGLMPGIEGYAKGAFWSKARMNWGQVCAGGLTMGALAVGDEEPAVARKMLGLTMKSIPLAMSAFVPDGGCPEGPGYWNYATDYNVIFLSALQTALGTDFDYLQEPGFSQTAEYPIYMTGPTGKFFNFADCGESSEAAPQMFWLAKAFGHPEWADWQIQHFGQKMGIFDLIWYDQVQPNQNPLPPDRFFRGVNVVSMRSDWTGRNAWFVGFKGGDDAANHAHLDLGTFVLDALGQRWAMELGSDDYNLPGYFGAQRWSYYRLRTEGQNTLTMDGQNQPVKSAAPIIEFASHPNWASAIADLSAAYPRAGSARRGIALLDRRRVLIQDELTMRRPADVVWNFHTPANVRIVPAGAILSKGNAKLRVRLLEPAGAEFETISANPPPPQKQNPGVANMIIRLPHFTGGRIAVLFSELDDATIPPLRALDEWPDR